VISSWLWGLHAVLLTIGGIFVVICSTSTYLDRLATFTANKAKVMAHNIKVAAAASRAGNADADAPGHTLKLNQFADWRREEFDRVMLPKKWKRDHSQQDPQQVSSASRMPAVTAKDWQTAVLNMVCALFVLLGCQRLPPRVGGGYI
jgi:hypothetical protein